MNTQRHGRSPNNTGRRPRSLYENRRTNHKMRLLQPSSSAIPRGTAHPRQGNGVNSSLRDGLRKEANKERAEGMKSNSTAIEGWASLLVHRLFRCRHHDWTMICNYWSTTLISGFGMTLEERCDNCGAYRHRLLLNIIGSTPEWHEGKHPLHIPPTNSES